MKIILPITAAILLTACAHNQQEVRGYGNDGLPSAEVVAFQQMDGRLKYGNARIEHDENRCAVYQGTAPDGQVKREALLDGAGKPICTRP